MKYSKQKRRLVAYRRACEAAIIPTLIAGNFRGAQAAAFNAAIARLAIRQIRNERGMR